MSDKHYTGKCFCGAVEITASGEPFTQGYCHCKDCRSWSGGPVNAYTLWKRDAVSITKGEEHVKTFARSDASHRMFCSKCGGNLMVDAPNMDFIDVFAATLPDLEFKPEVHLNYASAVLPMKDGLPKLKDFPAEAGGSGEMLPE